MSQPQQPQPGITLEQGYHEACRQLGDAQVKQALLVESLQAELTRVTEQRDALLSAEPAPGESP